MKSLVLALFLLPGAALAQEDLDCDPNGPQIALNMCAQMDWDEADVELNAAYKRALAVMEEMDLYQEPANQIGVKTLKEAQRAWITFRDKACEAESFTFFGGSAAPMIYSGCAATLTRARTEDLLRIADIGGQ